MRRTIRIGNAGGYWGDDPGALKRQIEGGPLDYLRSIGISDATMEAVREEFLEG